MTRVRRRVIQQRDVGQMLRRNVSDVSEEGFFGTKNTSGANVATELIPPPKTIVKKEKKTPQMRSPAPGEPRCARRCHRAPASAKG